MYMHAVDQPDLAPRRRAARDVDGAVGLDGLVGVVDDALAGATVVSLLPASTDTLALPAVAGPARVRRRRGSARSSAEISSPGVQPGSTAEPVSAATGTVVVAAGREPIRATQDRRGERATAGATRCVRACTMVVMPRCRVGSCPTARRRNVCSVTVAEPATRSCSPRRPAGRPAAGSPARSGPAGQRAQQVERDAAAVDGTTRSRVATWPNEPPTSAVNSADSSDEDAEHVEAAACRSSVQCRRGRRRAITTRVEANQSTNSARIRRPQDAVSNAEARRRARRSA